MISPPQQQRPWKAITVRDYLKDLLNFLIVLIRKVSAYRYGRSPAPSCLYLLRERRTDRLRQIPVPKAWALLPARRHFLLRYVAKTFIFDNPSIRENPLRSLKGYPSSQEKRRFLGGNGLVILMAEWLQMQDRQSRRHWFKRVGLRKERLQGLEFFLPEQLEACWIRYGFGPHGERDLKTLTESLSDRRSRTQYTPTDFCQVRFLVRLDRAIARKNQLKPTHQSLGEKRGNTQPVSIGEPSAAQRVLATLIKWRNTVFIRDFSPLLPLCVP